MRYWLFDGNDVVGPFSPQELAARADFSAVSMVAPETQSEDQQSWKTAASFADFQFDDEGHPVAPAETVPEATAPTPTEEPVVPEPTVPLAMPTQEVAPAIHNEPEKIEPIALVEPIHLAPAPEETIPLSHGDETESAPETETSPQQISEESPDEAAPESAPDTTILSTCTLPLTQNAQSFVALPKVEDAAQMMQQPEPEPFSTDLEEPVSVRETVKTHLESNTEIDDFLHEQQVARRPNREKAKWMLWVLLLLLIPGMIAFAVRWGVTHPKRLSTAPVVAKEPVSAQIMEEKKAESVPATVSEKPIEEAKPAENPPVQKPVKPANPTAADRAIETVKNHVLSGNKGTVSAYFSRLYKKELSSGYREEWSAEPLHKNIYIVKYRLTKTRQEPIVYVFQADTSKSKLTGALNNVALDLIGKI